MPDGAPGCVLAALNKDGCRTAMIGKVGEAFTQKHGIASAAEETDVRAKMTEGGNP